MSKSDPYVEIIRLAISKEVDAYTLYGKMASQAGDPGMKNLFLELVTEEMEHKARLELELMKLGIVVPETKTKKNNSADQEPEEPVQQMDYRDLLIFAMQKERSAMRLYIHLATLAKDNESREMLALLAEEEAMHQARFEVEYNFLMRKKSE
jgi:rubrerythrin